MARTWELNPTLLKAGGAVAGTYAVYRLFKALRNRRCSAYRNVVSAENRHHILANGFSAKQVGLSRSERGMFLQSKLFKGSMKVCLRLNLSGPSIDHKALDDVLSLLQKRHPFLRACVREVGDEFVFAETNARVPVIVQGRESDQDWSKLWRSVETQTATDGELLWCVALLQQEGQASTDIDLLLIIDHAICDGVSICALAHELLALLSQQDILPYNADTPASELSLRVPPSVEGAIRDHYDNLGGPLTWLSQVVRFIWRATVKKDRTVHASIVPDTTVPLMEMAAKCVTQHFFFELSAKENAALLARCRAKKTTITAALSVSIAMALGNILPPTDRARNQIAFKIGLGVDLRPRYAVQIPRHDVAYHVGGLQPNLLKFDYSSIARRDADIDADMFWTAAKDTRQSLIDRLATGETHIIGWLIGFLYNMGLKQTELPKDRVSFTLSNWGVSHISDRYGEWEINRVTPVVNLTRINSPAVLCVTSSGRLVVTFLAPTVAFDPKTLQHLAERSKTILLDACQ